MRFTTSSRRRAASSSPNWSGGSVVIDHRIRKPHEPMIEIGPVGECIYCGEREAPLTDEHIIPDGLGGNLLLTKSSCVKCAKIIGAYEQFILRKMLGGARHLTGIKSLKSIRKKQAKPDTVRIDVDSDRAKSRFVSLEQEPPYIIPLFLTDSWPGMLLHPPSSHLGVRANFIMPLDVVDRARKFAGPKKKLTFGVLINFVTFSQMLAKIAHSFAVAKIGLSSFEPFLCDYILHGSPQIRTDLIGSHETEEFYSLHDIQLQRYTSNNVMPPVDYWLCTVRLFSSVGGTPSYTIVVGRAV